MCSLGSVLGRSRPAIVDTQFLMIRSPSNPKIRLAQSVREGRNRGLALVEGERGVMEALEAGLEFELLLATPEATEAIERDMPVAVETLRPLATSPQLLAELTDLGSPRDAIAVVRRPLPPAGELPADPPARAMVYADQVQDPVNLGALARVCAASGVDTLLTSPGCAHPNHHRAIRASAFSLLTLSTYPQVRWPDLRSATASTSTWLALDPRAQQTIYDCEIASPLVVVIGGEMGIAPEHLQEVPCAAIPMPGKVESLNLAVAAGIALFEWVRRL